MQKIKNSIVDFCEQYKNIFLVLYFIVGILFTIFLDQIIFLFVGVSIPGLASVGDRMLFITFWALIWYAWETRGMKEQMTLQNKSKFRPVIICQFFKKNRKLLHYFIEEGSYPLAKDVKVEAVNCETKKNIILCEHLAFSTRVSKFIKEEDVDLNFDHYNFEISYNDINDNCFRTVFRIDGENRRKLIFK